MDKEQAKFDLTFLNKISGGDKNFIKEMVTTFKELVPEFISNSKQYLDEQNYEALSREAHKFLPGVSFLGIKHLEKDLCLVEEYAKKKINLDEIPGLVAKSFEEINDIIDIFDRELDFN